MRSNKPWNIFSGPFGNCNDNKVLYNQVIFRKACLKLKFFLKEITIELQKKNEPTIGFVRYKFGSFWIFLRLSVVVTMMIKFQFWIEFSDLLMNFLTVENLSKRWSKKSFLFALSEFGFYRLEVLLKFFSFFAAKLEDVINSANNNKWPSMTSCNTSLLLQQSAKANSHLNHGHHHHHSALSGPFSSLLSAGGSPGYILGGDPLGLNKVVNASTVNHLYWN